MRILKLVSVIFLVSVLLYSCTEYTTQKKNPYNPTTLKELHDGFFDKELLQFNTAALFPKE